MKIEKALPLDVPQLGDLRPEGWYDLRPVFKFYTETNYCFPLKASVANRIVGVGAMILHHEVGWLAHIVVHRDFRNRGIGRQLVETLVSCAEAHTCETVMLLATDLGEPVYKKVGFETEGTYQFFENVKSDPGWEKSGLIKPYQEEHKSQVALLDLVGAGENRFFRFEEHLATGHVFENEGKVKGFYLPDFGDGLIISSEEQAGIALMKYRLQHSDQVAFPDTNLTALQFMRDNNYEAFKTAKRMWLGKKRKPVLSQIYNRVAGAIG